MALALNQTTAVDLGSLGITDYPFTMVGWFRVPGVANLLTLMRIDNTATTSYHTVVYEGHSTGQVAAISKVEVTGGARTTSSMTPGHWQHVVGVFEAHNSRRVYLDGGNMGSGLHSRVFDGANQFRAGNISSSTAVDAAEVAFFASVLSTAEIQMLARGCPLWSLPQAGHLLTYQDCLRGINRPGLGPQASVAAAPAPANHPRVLMANGGRALAQPCRAAGPFQVDQESCRTSFAERGQLSVAGAADDAGQLSVAGIATSGSIHLGEVRC